MRPDDCTTAGRPYKTEFEAIRNILEIVENLESSQQARVLAYTFDYATTELGVQVVGITED